LIEAQNAGIRGRYQVYNLVMRPWLWLLSRTTDCRIYENKTVREIIEDVFTRAGFSSGTDFEWRLHESYEKREYTVQYRETDLAFVSRLMEEEGIFYFFEHSQNHHTCVLGDSKSAYREAPKFPSVPVVSIVGADYLGREHLFDWHSERRTRTGKVVLNDYDFKKPSTKLEVNAQAENSKYEFFDHPVNYKERGLGEKRAKVRLEAEQAHDKRRYANGDAAPIYAGCKIKLEQSDRNSENRDYFVVRATHSYVTEAYESSNDPSAANDAYDGVYEFQEYDHPYRAPQVTPRPLVYGMHTGKVCGPGGDEIHVDEHGRIRVQFFWDRLAGYPKSISRWTRVAQVWAGSGWGGQFIPRVGMEVVVIYEEGDPDHPIVIGCVFNGDNKYPYPMPGQKTQSGLKSNSSLGGGGYNEFMFEDKKGGEIIRMHAEKDHEVTILNKETTTIGERFMPMKGSPSREHTLKMGDDNLTINMGDQNLKINMGDQNVNIGLGNQKTFVMQNVQTDSLMSNKTTVLVSSIAMTPASIAQTSPTISLTAMGTISLTAPVINITGVVNLTGVLNITGGLTVNTMVPVLIPA
jgi:type VI secretion system secreted protein VgrG